MGGRLLLGLTSLLLLLGGGRQVLLLLLRGRRWRQDLRWKQSLLLLLLLLRCRHAGYARLLRLWQVLRLLWQRLRRLLLSWLLLLRRNVGLGCWLLVLTWLWLTYNLLEARLGRTHDMLLVADNLLEMVDNLLLHRRTNNLM